MHWDTGLASTPEHKSTLQSLLGTPVLAVPKRTQAGCLREAKCREDTCGGELSMGKSWGKIQGACQSLCTFPRYRSILFWQKISLLMALQILCKSQDNFPGSLLVEND